MEISLERLVKLFKKNLIPIIAVALVLAILTGLYSTYFIKPKYTSSARFRINIKVDVVNDTLTYTARLLSLVNEVIGMFDSDQFYDLISEKMDGRYSPGQIASKISFQIESEDTTYFRINATTDNPQDAKMLVNAVADNAKEYVSSLGQLYELTMMKRGTTPGAPSSPNIFRNAIMGFALGLFLACAFVVIRDLLDRRVKTTADLTERFGCPILGVVPKFETEGSKESSGAKEERK